MAAMGAAIGTGNIWRFSKEAASNGGGSFLLAYVLLLFIWSIPLLMTEFAIGKATRKGTVGAFNIFAGRNYAWMGVWMVIVSTAINCYYAVVMGWTVRYFFVAATGQLGSAGDAAALWNGFLSNPGEVVLFQVVAVGVGAFIVHKGIIKGIERANKILLPTLFTLLMGLALWSITRPGAIHGLYYLFVPQPEYLLKGETWLAALTQVAWSCSAGMGMAITYAIYMKRREDTVLNSFITGLGDTSASLIVGVAIFGTVFAMAGSLTEAETLVHSAGPQFVFVALTDMFLTMPGGAIIAIIFFMAVVFAALTSLISGFEIAVSNFIDYGWTRDQSIKRVALLTLLLGLPSSTVVLFYGGDMVPVFLDNQDHVWGVGLLLSGLFVAFAVWKYGVAKFRRDFLDVPENDIRVGVWYEAIMYMFPVLFLVLLSWALYQSATGDPSEFWINGPVGVGLLVLQWGLALAVILYLNRRISRRFPGDREEFLRHRDSMRAQRAKVIGTTPTGPVAGTAWATGSGPAAA